mgnify:CR=1 FL=1
MEFPVPFLISICLVCEKKGKQKCQEKENTKIREGFSLHFLLPFNLKRRGRNITRLQKNLYREGIESRLAEWRKRESQNQQTELSFSEIYTNSSLFFCLKCSEKNHSHAHTQFKIFLLLIIQILHYIENLAFSWCNILVCRKLLSFNNFIHLSSSLLSF